MVLDARIIASLLEDHPRRLDSLGTPRKLHVLDVHLTADQLTDQLTDHFSDLTHSHLTWRGLQHDDAALKNDNLM